MDVIPWVVAVIIAVVAWKFLKGLIKLALFLVAVAIIAWQIYPYVAGLLSGAV